MRIPRNTASSMFFWLANDSTLPANFKAPRLVPWGIRIERERAEFALTGIGVHGAAAWVTCNRHSAQANPGPYDHRHYGGNDA